MTNTTTRENNNLPNANRIPKLYESENIPVDEKIIHRRYEIKEISFYWLLAELDPIENLAFGFANLNDDQMSEWGYFYISELISNGALLDRNWKPCKFAEAKKKIAEENETKKFLVPQS